MLFDVKFDYIIPFGNNCSATTILGDKRNYRLPFDWLQVKSVKHIYLIYLKIIYDALQNKLNYTKVEKNRGWWKKVMKILLSKSIIYIIRIIFGDYDGYTFRDIFAIIFF